MSQIPSINPARLIARIQELGTIGRDSAGRMARLTGTDADKAGRDRLAGWIGDAGLALQVDAFGNMFGLLNPSQSGEQPVMAGSHIDSVIDAGIYDGCYGVLAALEVAQSLGEAGIALRHPLVIAAFTNEEGVRYAPAMLGSLVHAGGKPLDEALATIGTDGSVLGEEIARIGYAGGMPVGTIRPHAYVELHIEQGPILEHEGLRIGAVENLQGLVWQRVTITGDANHAGTTPTSLRRDAGYAAARIITFLRDYVTAANAPTVATVGTIAFHPNAINVIPSQAVLTVDIRDPDAGRLRAAEAALAQFLAKLATETRVEISSEKLADFAPVIFDQGIVRRIEASARRHGHSCRRMTSGAGHDAQMIARLCPAAMIFVPSIGGISHNPKEFTPEADLIAGANVLFDVVRDLCGA